MSRYRTNTSTYSLFKGGVLRKKIPISVAQLAPRLDVSRTESVGKLSRKLTI